MLTEEIRKLRKFDEDLEWFQRNYEKLKKEYKGEYVAVKNRKIIDHDKDARMLLGRLKQKYNNISSLVVEYISEHKVEYVLSGISTPFS